jgi:AcrR family transcriptional regulator
MFTEPLNRYLHTEVKSINDLRISPRQERSRRTLDVILDTTAAVVAADGFTAVTTADIGTFYRFYPDREALLTALRNRTYTAYLEHLIAAYDRKTPRTWKQAVSTMIDITIECYRTIPAFAIVHLSLLAADADEREAHLRRAALYLEAIVESLAEFGLPSSKAWRTRLEVALEQASALTALAFLRDPEGDRRILAEARRLPIDYLQEYAASL